MTRNPESGPVCGSSGVRCVANGIRRGPLPYMPLATVSVAVGSGGRGWWGTEMEGGASTTTMHPRMGARLHPPPVCLKMPCLIVGDGCRILWPLAAGVVRPI